MGTAAPPPDHCRLGFLAGCCGHRRPWRSIAGLARFRLPQRRSLDRRRNPLLRALRSFAAPSAYGAREQFSHRMLYPWSAAASAVRHSGAPDLRGRPPIGSCHAGSCLPGAVPFRTRISVPQPRCRADRRGMRWALRASHAGVRQRAGDVVPWRTASSLPRRRRGIDRQRPAPCQPRVSAKSCGPPRTELAGAVLASLALLLAACPAAVGIAPCRRPDHPRPWSKPCQPRDRKTFLARLRGPGDAGHHGFMKGAIR